MKVIENLCQMQIAFLCLLKNIINCDSDWQQSGIGDGHVVGVDFDEDISTSSVGTMHDGITQQFSNDFFVVCRNVLTP